MDEQSGVGTQELKKDRSNAQEGGIKAVAHTASGYANALPNGQLWPGENGTVPNGMPVTNGEMDFLNGEHANTSMDAASSDGPPRIEQPWRNEDSNKHLGKLMDRLAQQCYIDLNKTLTEMTAQDDAAAVVAPRINGLSAQGLMDTSEVSLRKKRMLMDFAHDQRDRFTKTLVLSDWSRNAEEMANIIDVRVWQETQRNAYTFAANAIAATKFKSVGFKVPAPNIDGAMEVLGTGKASWVPDMGYIPPKRLTAKQLLKTLKSMNVTLATRLNLHEELPPHMNDFSIADGRATFTVPGEFEVDLSVADEETTSPFYFIDFRFLFSPSSNALNEQIRAHLEFQTNRALASKSLQGCYDFLHNFVLTHKINVLRSQGAELIREEWFDCIKVENMRRNLVVQYWASMPGPKSWIEIGISSGKKRTAGTVKSRNATPRLCVRWFRKGQEVTDEVLNFDWETLSLKKCLMTVIGMHCFGKLGVTRDGLHVLATENAASEVLEVELSSSEVVAPEDCALQLRLPSMKKPLSVRLEPVTGLFSISPATNATMNSERTLNSDPQVDVARLLASLSCAVVQERIRKQAELLGWQVVRIPVSAKPICGHGVLQQTIFSVPGWCQQWALAVSCGLGGERWWAVQLSESKPSEPSKAVAKEVNATRELPVKDVLGEKIVDASRATLLAIERLAVAEVSYTVLSQQLRSMRIPHQTEKPVSNVTNGTDTRQPSTGAVYLQFAALMRDVRDKSWEAWATDSVRVSPGGIEDSGEEMNTDGKQALVRHDLRLNLAPGKMKHLQQLLSKSRDRDVAMNGHGGLAIRLRTPFGEPFVEHIRTRLRNLECLDRYVTTLQKLHYNLTAVSMAKLSFAYSDIAPVLHAQLTFASNGTGPMRLKLGPADSNPHQRIRVMLEQCLLNGTAKEAFQLFAQLLTFTLPTLQALERIERIRGTHQTVTIRVRGAAWYNLSYKAPSPACAFSIRLRPKRQGNKTVAHWHVEPTKDQTDGVAIAEELAKGLKALWQTKGKGWVGVGSGAIADTTGIGAVLEALDELVRASDAPLIAPAPEMPTGAVPKTTEQPPPLPLQAKEPQKKPAVEPAAKAAKQPAAGAKKKEEPEYIELD
ncbi:mediator complex subunit [Friedmanniomyces endolithicus]|uniref:Mediator of RNA polymerase II transcription subunit 14 n=1 Tax=Friedmanniomyces endolithicus TaxID=329885 RepID=A0AAN6K6S1_9PEZI|nr:mediator complex subunit [Friedmanniomyces endolithicus]KAK0965036.1 mediator complex subunit [Friedmanniomyces endolithicus]KAK0967579.1 mediator complex subunit [Friedmanniomyces endolithicus]KAK1029637.1 mediator complex subunit [Friedmanniomyces endolithicus]